MLLPTFIEQVNWSDGTTSHFNHYWSNVPESLEEGVTYAGKIIAIFKIIPRINLSKLL